MMEPDGPASVSLSGCTVALPETRQLDVLAGLLERRGASVLRCPLVAIHDSPDTEAVLGWLRRFIEAPPDIFVLFTGEGVRRLRGFAERAGLHDAFVGALSQTRKISRGPKPGRALREVGLSTDLLADSPTTEGLISTLENLPLEGRRVAVQLYGQEPNPRLMDHLRGRGVEPDCVAPYVYAPNNEDRQVLELIEALAAGRIDIIAFTSMPQYRRLESVARQGAVTERLADGLRCTQVAAIGPVVAHDLRERGVRVDLMPSSSWFMKPLVSEIERVMQQR